MSCSAEKKLLNYFKFMLAKQSDQVQQKFEKKLLDFLTNEEVLIWKLNKPVESYLGSELKTFTKKGADIAAWVEKEKLVSEQDPEWKPMCKALRLWAKCYEFLVKAKVEDDEDYEAQIKQYEKNMVELYKCGSETFFKSVNGTPAMGETVYFHMLLCQVPKWARITYKRHGVGVGVFTLQGIERRNKKKKHQFTKHTNSKGNMCMQTLRKCTDEFEIY